MTESTVTSLRKEAGALYKRHPAIGTAAVAAGLGIGVPIAGNIIAAATGLGDLDTIIDMAGKGGMCMYVNRAIQTKHGVKGIAATAVKTAAVFLGGYFVGGELADAASTGGLFGALGDAYMWMHTHVTATVLNVDNAGATGGLTALLGWGAKKTYNRFKK
jgi:hypothetical protein